MRVMIRSSLVGWIATVANQPRLRLARSGEPLHLRREDRDRSLRIAAEQLGEGAVLLACSVREPVATTARETDLVQRQVELRDATATRLRRIAGAGTDPPPPLAAEPRARSLRPDRERDRLPLGAAHHGVGETEHE